MLSGRPTLSWEYKKINLNAQTRRADDIDLLCDAGHESWELVTILPNNMAYMKRELDAEVPQHGDEASGVKAKYRDPATGETWSGRGRMANWLRRKQEAGEDIGNYLA